MQYHFFFVCNSKQVNAKSTESPRLVSVEKKVWQK